MNYTQDYDTELSVGKPHILYQNDKFLSFDEISHYQSLLKNYNWGLSNYHTLDKLFYVSQNLYRHYAWDGKWDAAQWLDSTPPDWEQLYNKISEHLPPHYVHWIDVKMTGSYQGGTPIHRDKDPWTKNGDTKKFSNSIAIICNLNIEWDARWGGGLTLYETKNVNGQLTHTVDQVIPIVPGQLLIVNNCFHSIELITEPSRNRVSFILHVLKYK